jgi:hypothetical protein
MISVPLANVDKQKRACRLIWQTRFLSITHFSMNNKKDQILIRFLLLVLFTVQNMIQSHLKVLGLIKKSPNRVIYVNNLKTQNSQVN